MASSGAGLLTAVCLSTVFFVALAIDPPNAQAVGTTPLTAGPITMISTHADNTSGGPSIGVEGANQVAINDDGSAVAFVSDVPAQDLVTDPVQLARGVTDSNTGVGTTNKGDDVFLYQKLPAPENPIISLVSENVTGTGTGNAPSDRPVMAPSGLGLVFQSGATDMVGGQVDANQNHIYAWAAGLGSLTGVFLIDTKYQSSDACNCAATNPSISLTGPLGPTVVFEATGGGPTNELVAPGVLGQGENQVYAHSIVANTNTLVSVTSNSTVPNARSSSDPDVGNGAVGGASEPLIASDAPIVVFTAIGDDLVKDFDSSNGSNIWERNLLLGTTTLVSVSAAGDPNGTSGNDSPVISNFGTSVAWQSNSNDVSATPFPPTQQNQPFDHVYFKVVLPVALPSVMVDTDWTGALACDTSSDSAGVSGDGLSVVFDSNCSDIAKPAADGGTAPDTNNNADVFERTLAPIPDAAAKLLSVNDAGDGSGNGGSLLCAPDDGNYSAPCADHTNPSVGINFDGSAVTYFTDATDIARPTVGTPPFNDGTVIMSYPQILGGVKNALVSFRSTDGAYADDTSGDPVVSKDGSSVAFISSAGNLVPGDNNGYFDVFESDLHNSFLIQPVAPVDEGAGSVLITVARTGNNGTSDSVDVKTGDGFDTSIAPNPFPTATEAFEPGDYTATDVTLHFPPGVAVQTFNVPIIDDNTVEGPELFHVSMSPSGAGSAGLPGPASDAYVEILDNDVAPQDWSVSTDQQPPASAQVGDTVAVKAKISVGPGASDLTVNKVTFGAATMGLDQLGFPNAPPTTIAAGTAQDVEANARVVAAPGAAGTRFEVSVDGTLGATNSIKSTDSNTVAVTEAVTALLSGAPATVGLPDQITYTLTLTNDSDTAAQVEAPDGGFAAATGTTLVSRTEGAATLAAGDSTAYTLTVSVDDADADGATIAEAPTGVAYGMSDISLAARAVTVTASTSTVQAPVVAVSAHTLTDVDGATLEPGDAVDVSVTVANTGAADTTATLSDALTDLTAPTNVKVDGVACGGCSSTASSVTAPLGTLAASGSHVVTFSASVPASPGGTTSSSSAAVSFSPATTGTSPTAADVASLTIGSANLQSWQVTISQQPPASAHVGDTVTVKAKITVGSGADNLDVTGLSSGVGTSGLDSVSFADATPLSVSAGSSKVVTATARVAAVPGTGGVKLQVSVDGTLGAASTTMTADSNAIISTEAVSATLSGGPATVTVADQITYTMTFTNASATPVQLTGLPAALIAPTGTTASGSPSGSTTVAAHDTTAWTLTVDVDDADPDGTVLTQLPGAVAYAMSGVGLAARPVAVTPASVTSTVHVPDTTDPDVTINEAAGQADPTSTAPVHFTVAFSEPVSGFDSADVDLSTSSVGGVLSSVVTGGPVSFDVAVSGMTTGGAVVARIAAGAAIDGAFNPSTASTSTDNSIAWVQAIASNVTVSLTPASSVYGQPVVATATVGVTSGTAAGTVRFAVDGADVGSPVTLGAGGTALSPTLTAAGGVAPAAGSHTITATFAPTDPVAYIGSSGSTGLVVDKAATHTAVFVAPTTLRATVAATAPGAGGPGGTVTFSVDGLNVGSASVSGGAAALTYTTPSGKTRHIAALYSGDANFTASSASTARHDPTITAHLSSAHARTVYGWYRSSVTVSFTCATNGAPLVAACPSAVTLTHNGAAQSVSRTISAVDGGMATATAHGINLDHSLPVVTVTGVTNGGRYARPGPTPRCAASDALSGVASCTLTRSSTRRGDVTTVHYTATAKDRAGNVRSTSGSFQLSSFGLQGVTFSNGAYTVHRGRTYLIVVNSSTVPAFYDAVPFPTTPSQPDPSAMRSAGYHRWSLPVTMTASMRSHLYWNVGIQVGRTLHVLKIRVLA